MECPKCQKELSSNSQFCNFCGQEISHNFSLHPVPEGFVFDRFSGWYHKIELKRSKKGKLTQEVTYFNPDKNWFLTELSSDHWSYKKGKKQTENGPIGQVADYLFDEIQELYYLTDVQKDGKSGEMIQRVSYFNPQEKSFINMNYLILDVNPRKPAKPITTSVEQDESEEVSKQKSEENQDEKPEKKTKKIRKKRPKKKRTTRSVCLRILSLILAVFAVILGTYYGLVWFGAIAPGTLEARLSNATISAKAFPNKIVGFFEKKKKAWPQFPHVSSLYKQAFQEGNYLYFLGTTEIETAALYRFDVKTGLNEIIVESPDSINLLAAFTVTPNYIYYSLAKENDSEAKYYRIHKETGEFQYLFETDNSSLVVSKDSVYIILSANNKLRKINEITNNPSDYVDIEIPPTTDDSYVLSNNFSIIGNDLYYCELKDKIFRYYHYNLETKSKEQLLYSATQDATIINPYWINGTANYTVINEKEQTISLVEEGASTNVLAQFRMELLEDPARYFATSVGDEVVYATDQGTMIMGLNQQGGVRISTGAPVAICDDWIILENSVFSIKDRSLHYVSSRNLGNRATLGQSSVDNSEIPSSADSTDGEISSLIHNEIFEIAALMAMNNPYDELSSGELVSQMNVLFLNLPYTSNLVTNGRLEIAPMSDLLWELFSVDYNYFAEVVHSELAAGFVTRSDGIYYDREAFPKSVGITLQSVEQDKNTDKKAMLVTISTPTGTKKILVFYQKNENYAISQYKLIGTKRIVDSAG